MRYEIEGTILIINAGAYVSEDRILIFEEED